jgi:hypothetical protein
MTTATSPYLNHDPRPLTPREAYELASDYGSFIRAGDPGACFYGFYFSDGRPVSETHRQQCLSYVRRLLVEMDAPARRDLRRLKTFFHLTELRP